MDNRKTSSPRVNWEVRDLLGFVDEVKRRFEEEVKLPAGYYLSYGGEFRKSAESLS